MDDEKWDYPVEHGEYARWAPEELVRDAQKKGLEILYKSTPAVSDESFRAWGQSVAAALEMSGMVEVDAGPHADESAVVTLTEEQIAFIHADWAELIAADEPAPEPVCAAPEPPSHRYIPDPELVDPAVDVMAMVRRFS